MTCSMPDGIELYFPRSGVRIRPYEADVKLKKRNYASGRFTVSADAGKVIGNNVAAREPAYFMIDGEPAYRLVILDDSIEFRRNFDKDDEAEVELYDARHILDGGAISKLFEVTSLDDVVSYILEQRDDPYGVITGVNYVSETDKQELLDDIGTRAAEQIEFRPGEFFDSLQLVADTHPDVQTLNFDDISPKKAMEKTFEEVEYDFWVDIDGTMYVGLDETWGQRIGIVDQSNFSINRLSLIESRNKTDTVIVKAPHQNDPTEFKKSSLRLVAQANAPGIDGGTNPKEMKQGTTLRGIEKIAERALLREITGDISGSVVFNGMASKDKETLRRMTIGDQIFIDGEAFDGCRVNAISGQYSITNIHHRVNPRQGWRADVDLAYLPPEDIKSDAFYFDPHDNKTYEDIEAYKTELRTEPGPGGP